MENTLFNQMHEVENHHWWFVSRRNIIESVINKISFHGKPNILDIGCGNGDNLEMLAKFGNLVAMERDVNALNRAQERNMCPVYSGDLPNNISPEINKDNDLIVMLDVLEHVSEDGECLANLKQYINDNGRLLITVPAYQFLWSKHDEIHHHKRRYTISDLKNKLQSNEFNIEFITYFNTFLFPLALIHRLLEKVYDNKKNDDLSVPNFFINKIFTIIFKLEKFFIGKIVFPFGLSIMVMATKNN